MPEQTIQILEALMSKIMEALYVLFQVLLAIFVPSVVLFYFYFVLGEWCAVGMCVVRCVHVRGCESVRAFRRQAERKRPSIKMTSKGADESLAAAAAGPVPVMRGQVTGGCRFEPTARRRRSGRWRQVKRRLPDWLLP